jgi:hypothetical protein
MQFLFICIIAIAALFLFFKSRRYLRLYEENSTFDIINKLYSQFHTLTNIQLDWHLAHLLCINREEYEITCTKIKAAIVDYSEKDLYELQIKEKHMIINILVFYEQVYYQFNHSKMFKKRRQFLYNLNDYFLDRLLYQNPRLVYQVIANPLGIGLHMEEESYQDILIKYEERLSSTTVTLDSATKDKKNSQNCNWLWYDDKGPFFMATKAELQKLENVSELNSYISQLKSINV